MDSTPIKPVCRAVASREPLVLLSSISHPENDSYENRCEEANHNYIRQVESAIAFKRIHKITRSSEHEQEVNRRNNSEGWY